MRQSPPRLRVNADFQGEISLTDWWRSLAPIERLDLLRDWIFDLSNLYDRELALLHVIPGKDTKQ